MPLSVRARLAAQQRRLAFRASAAAGLAPAQPPVPRPAAPAAPTTQWQQAMARPVGEAALGAAWDARRAKGAAPRARWGEDAGPVFGYWPDACVEEALRGVR